MSMSPDVRIRHVGDAAIQLDWRGDAGMQHSAAAAAADALRQAAPSWLIDCVAAYDSLLVIVDAPDAGTAGIRAALRQLATESHVGLSDQADPHENDRKALRLPVYYDAECGEDLPRLAQQAGLSEAEFCALHAAQALTVQAIGFAPGFAYLGDLDPRLAAPRLANPRPRVPQGAVAIAGRQTAVYPAASPGGWNLIGRCPAVLFDVRAEPPMPLAVGDRVQFYSIDRDEFIARGGTL